MGDLERIEGKVDWLVRAVKALLEQEVDPELVEDLRWTRGDTGPLVYPMEVEDTSQFEHVAVRTPPKEKACPHNHQVLVDGMVKCARCGTFLTASGVRGKDPHSPVPAPGYEDTLSHVNSAGGPLAPHSL